MCTERSLYTYLRTRRLKLDKHSSLRTYSFLLSEADNHGLMVIYLQQDTTFSTRGQKLFYPRSEVFLLANRNISIRGQKNLYFYRTRRMSETSITDRKKKTHEGHRN